MNLRQFYVGKTIGFIIVLALVGAGTASYALFKDVRTEVPALKQEEKRVAENPEGEADPSRMTLGMTEWRWVLALYNDGREVRPKTFGDFTLTFEGDGRFSVKTDCNSMGGTYTTRGDAISFSAMEQTLMYCEGSLEEVFKLLLRDTSHYHFTSRGELILDLKFDSGSVTFR